MDSETPNNAPEAPQEASQAPSAPEPSTMPSAPAASPMGAAPMPQQSSTNGMAIAGLILAFFFPLVGLILSIVGLSHAKKNNGQGKGLAVAGIIVNSLFMIGTVLVFVLFVILGAQSANEANNLTSTSSDLSLDSSAYRADTQTKDIAVKAGEAATIDGVKMVLSNVQYLTTLGRYDEADAGKTYVTADVQLENTGSETQAYNVYDFRIQTPGGQVLDGSYATLEKPLNSGDLVAGGKASGQIVFEVPIEDGATYVIWKPSYYDATRAVVTIR